MEVSVGVDIIEVDRMRDILATNQERFLSRVFTRQERETVGKGTAAAERLAARFAAKEAAFKMLGRGWLQGVGWQDVEVQNDTFGKPVLRLLGQAAVLASERGVVSVDLSLSHTSVYAVASVCSLIAPSAPQPKDVTNET